MNNTALSLSSLKQWETIKSVQKGYHLNSLDGTELLFLMRSFFFFFLHISKSNFEKRLNAFGMNKDADYRENCRASVSTVVSI